MFLDLTEFGLKHQTFFSLDDIKKSAKLMQESIPLRFKAAHYYNYGPMFDAVMQLFLPFIKKKLKDRLNFHGNNMEVIYDKVIPMEILPTDYLPDDYKGKA